MKKRIVVTVLAVFIAFTTVMMQGSAVDEQAYSDYYTFIRNGDKVAELQNTYMVVYRDEQAYTIVYNTLKQYIDDAFKCSVWFGDYTWEFATRYSTKDDVQKALWFGRDNAGEVKAFCTGTYNYRTGMFSDISWNYCGRVEF